MAKAPPTVEIGAAARDEIVAIAARTGRSVAFIARRALSAAGAEARVAASDRAGLVLSTDEDDARDTHAKLRALAGARPLGEAIEGAWSQTRSRFFAWAAREEAAGE